MVAAKKAVNNLPKHNKARAFSSKAADGFRNAKKGVATLKGKFTSVKALKESQTGVAIKATVKEASQDDPSKVLEIEESEAPQPIFLSQEEAAQEVFKALNHYIELKRSLEKLSNANVVDLKVLGFKGRYSKPGELYPAIPRIAGCLDPANNFGDSEN